MDQIPSTAVKEGIMSYTSCLRERQAVPNAMELLNDTVDDVVVGCRAMWTVKQGKESYGKLHGR